MKSLHNCCIIPMLTLLLLVATSTWAATMYTGSLMSTQGELVSEWKTPNGPVSDVSLSWEVAYLDQQQLWSYTYLFSGGAPDISHGIIEVSENFSGLMINEGGNIDPGTSPFESGDPKIYNDSAQGNSNPNIPGDLFGIKFEDQASWTIITDRAPMWGDFYANGARTGYAYNSGFGMNTTASVGNGNAKTNSQAWALVPDTQVVPIPGAAWLLGIAVLGLFKMKNNKL